MSYAVRQLIKTYEYINYFNTPYFYFTGKPENLGKDNDEVMGEYIAEEGEEEFIDPLKLDLNDEELQSVEDVDEELVDENMEMEGEVESLLTDLKNEPEEEIESHLSKKVSDESFLSLPVTKLCTVVKLKNKFNFFDRVSQTKKIIMRVRLDNMIYFRPIIVCYIIYNTLLL